jgi:hypothetical protein
MIEAQRGESINWEELSPSTTSWFAEAYLSDLPDSLPNSLRNFWGSNYVIPLNADGQQVAALSIAAHAVDLREQDGRVNVPTDGGNEFRVQGVPFELIEGLPVTPEYAVKFVATSFGTRVAAVPWLAKADVRWVPLAARWCVTLERPVAAMRRSDGSAIEVLEVYVGHYPALGEATPSDELRLRMLAPVARQPPEATVRNGGDEFKWPILPGHPVEFTEIVPPAPAG